MARAAVIVVVSMNSSFIEGKALHRFSAVCCDSHSIRPTRIHLQRGFSPMANVLTVVARIRAAKDKGDALAALLSEQAAVVRNAEPGCLVYRVHRSTKEPELFFFFQAEDGIRDLTVTGVQTCALPI